MLVPVLGALALGAIVVSPCERTDVGSTPVDCARGHIEVRRALRKNLFGNFSVNQTLRDPVLEAQSRPRSLGFNMVLHRVSQLDPKETKFTIDVTVGHTFMDPRWCWNPADWCGTELLNGEQVREADVWTPHFVFEQAKMDVLSTNIMVRSTGILLMRQRVTLTVNCFMNFVYFPFDRQTCRNRMGAIGSLPSDIAYEFDGAPLIFDEEVYEDSVDVYEVLRPMVSMVREHDGVKQGNYVPMEFEIQFHRVRPRHMMNIFFPIWLVNILSILGLFIDAAAAPARVAMAIITVLVLINLQNRLTAQLPNLAYTSAMDVYFVVCLLMTIANAGEYAVINYFNTALRTQKTDIALRKRIREKCTKAKLSLRESDIGVVMFPVTLHKNVQSAAGGERRYSRAFANSNDSSIQGLLEPGDLVLVHGVKHGHDNPDTQFAMVTVLESVNEELYGKGGTLQVINGEDAPHMVVCDMEKTADLKRKIEQLQVEPREAAFLIEESHEPISEEPVRQSSPNNKYEKKREVYLQKTREKRMQEIWNSYILFLTGGAAAHETDVVALLHHYAGINPRKGQTWVDAASASGEDDDLIDFKEFEENILPRLEKHMTELDTNIEPNVRAIFGCCMITEALIRSIEKWYRIATILFFLLFNLLFFCIIVPLAG
eukprot:Hpha_TRINITY_DN34211_c0_g1::TRINITY_DN34211_c0_g1_i1::g.34463::m.34463